MPQAGRLDRTDIRISTMALDEEGQKKYCELALGSATCIHFQLDSIRLAQTVGPHVQLILFRAANIDSRIAPILFQSTDVV